MMRTDRQASPSTPTAWGAEPLVGQVLQGRFQVVAPLEGPGTQRVYRALQLPLERTVALRVLGAPFEDLEAPRRFFQEARAAARLAHPHTVTVLDAGRLEDGTLFVATEWLEGRTLQEVLASGPLPWARAVAWARALGRSLRQAHQRGVVHGDVSPGNVVLVEEAGAHVKLRGFGRTRPVMSESARLSVRELTEGDAGLGAPAYMAPERARHVADARGDIYSLGGVLFHMLMGRVPFESDDLLELVFAHHKEMPPRFSELRPDLAVPEAVEAVVRRCLEKRPEQRFASMEALLEALGDAASREVEPEQAPVRAASDAHRTRGPSWWGRWRAS
ncbi:serine/threonine-protein kinase [Myxococcus faecalis]|uniref:serine/threonine-protein kinase n=1 Tax=Myxococcus faecalis TaxID=3115646 RepID=UPI003CF40C41